ncbi:hypothetical protein EV188_105101 [Actinomycetospora succinea]|uniref:Uncharacterized protein n=1 Tax=Actinomycetospora succinea TaxID=663603 RepID=A0A4R6V5E9_9PSEU|nr:hypothetical protein [Actinomycetospora succinea]TDQ55705.1 hypothetical protein EV188_105101 [Actinomycetospora succinea]
MSELVLAFDAACTRCRAVAAAVADTVGPDLDVLPLADYRVALWRAEAGVERDGPTLIEITATDGDDRVRAWTGPALGPALVRRLGAGRTMRLLRALRAHGVLGDATRGMLRTPSPGRGA